jgi:hypothetical protein
MRTMMAVVITSALICFAGTASAGTVVTKNGTYEGGCNGSSCLYKPMKAPKAQQTHRHHKTS